MNTKTITLPTDVWEQILETVRWHDDCGPEGEGWQSEKLARASAALYDALKNAPEESPNDRG